MPFKIEAFNYSSSNWILVVTLNKGDRSGSISNIKGTEREVRFTHI